MDLAELRTLALFDGLSDDQLHDLLETATEVPFEDGDLIFEQGAPADYWWVLLEGRAELQRRAGHVQETVAIMDTPGVWAGGFSAWSEGVGYLGSGVGAGTGRYLRVPSGELRRLADAWFPFAVHIIRAMFQTVRTLEASSRDREALVALGTLAAGLAHELNNPASAASRAADALGDSCAALLSSLNMLAERSLTADEFLGMERLRADLVGREVDTDPVRLADREDEILAWLEDHGIADAWRIAPALAPVAVDSEWLERAAATVAPPTLGPALEWIAGNVSTRALLEEVKEATSRVSNLVAAVKSYSQMDRASLQVIDVTEGIESTLSILGQKLGDGVRVERNYEEGLPTIEAHPGELNQVWTNLIDNAIDAMDGVGTLRIATRVTEDRITVEIGDTGPGMPAEVQARAFEPFFTTKDVSKGTGLGLDISRRIVVDRHHGEISIDSGPSGTILQVSLPRSAD